jgi:hypothetical protein
LFTKSLRWAEASGFDAVKVLSARHGLVDIDQVIEPYDTALPRFTPMQRREWAAGVAERLLQVIGQRNGAAEVCALAGRHYTDELALHLQRRSPATRFHRPMAGLGIGEQKAWLKRELLALPSTTPCTAPRPPRAERRPTAPL